MISHSSAYMSMQHQHKQTVLIGSEGLIFCTSRIALTPDLERNAPAGSSGLDLAGGEAHGQVGDEGVLRFAASVAGHHAPPRILRVLHRLHRDEMSALKQYDSSLTISSNRIER